MDQKALSQILDSVAAKHTSAETDLLPAIQARLKHNRPTRPIWQSHPIRRVASIVVGLLLVVTTVYAAQLLIRDPGLQENMVTPLNLSQTKADVTVTLDWAYADANRIKLAYTVTSVTEPIVKDWVTDVTLTDQEIPRESQEIFGFASLVDIQEDAPNIYNVEANFELDDITHTESTIDLRLRVMGIYRFEFSVPFDPGIRIEKQPDVSAAGLNANLEWAIITPSMTRAYICYETPDEEMWVANVLLSYDGEPVALEPEASGRGSGPNNGPYERWCTERRFLTSYDNPPQELTFTIPSLQTPTVYSEADMRVASEVFAKYGVKTEVKPSSSEPGSGYTLNWLSPIPDNEQFSAIWKEAIGAMDDSVRWESVAGPWHLTITLP